MRIFTPQFRRSVASCRSTGGIGVSQVVRIGSLVRYPLASGMAGNDLRTRRNRSDRAGGGLAWRIERNGASVMGSCRLVACARFRLVGAVLRIERWRNRAAAVGLDFPPAEGCLARLRNAPRPLRCASRRIRRVVRDRGIPRQRGNARHGLAGDGARNAGSALQAVRSRGAPGLLADAAGRRVHRVRFRFARPRIAPLRG